MCFLWFNLVLLMLFNYFKYCILCVQRYLENDYTSEMVKGN